MTPDERRIGTETFERTIAGLRTERYVLTLFVSGASSSSARAVASVRHICDEHLGGRHQLDIVDLHQQPTLARRHNVLATPTLIRDHPLPPRMLVGDMSDHAAVLAALGVPIEGPVAVTNDPIDGVDS
jgi:circadian clock protein KaiB